MYASTLDRWKTNEKGGIEFYWRVRRRADQAYVWRGYGTRGSVEKLLVQLVAAGRTEPSRKKVPRPEIGTFGEVIEAWYEWVKMRPDLAPSTVGNYEKCARHLKAWIGGVLVARLDGAAMEGYRDDRLREGAAPRTVELEMKALRMVWRWGRDRGMAPARDLPRVRVRINGYVINHRTPTAEEVALVFERLDGAMLLVVRLLAITGARVSSACAIQESDLDDVRGLRIPDTKTGPRRFPISPEMSAVLRDHFSANPGPLLRGSALVVNSQVNTALANACSAVGIERFASHGFRRLVVNRMIRAGVDPATAASLTGHSVQVMMRYYREVSEDDRRQAVLQAGLDQFPGSPG